MSCSVTLVKHSSKTHPKCLPNSPPQKKTRYPTVWGTIINIFTILHQILPGIFHRDFLSYSLNILLYPAQHKDHQTWNDIRHPLPWTSMLQIQHHLLKGRNLKIAARSINMHIHNTSFSCVKTYIHTYFIHICKHVYGINFTTLHIHIHICILQQLVTNDSNNLPRSTKPVGIYMSFHAFTTKKFMRSQVPTTNFKSWLQDLKSPQPSHQPSAKGPEK